MRRFFFLLEWTILKYMKFTAVTYNNPVESVQKSFFYFDNPIHIFFCLLAFFLVSMQIRFGKAMCASIINLFWRVGLPLPHIGMRRLYCSALLKKRYSRKEGYSTIIIFTFFSLLLRRSITTHLHLHFLHCQVIFWKRKIKRKRLTFFKSIFMCTLCSAEERDLIFVSSY